MVEKHLIQQVSMFTENRPGRLAAFAQAMEEAGIHIMPSASRRPMVSGSSGPWCPIQLWLAIGSPIWRAPPRRLTRAPWPPSWLTARPSDRPA